METKTLLEQPKDGVFLRAIKAKEANRKNLVLVKKKPDVQTYADILRAIQIGASRPGMIVMSTGISWITVMQCLRTLEQKGLISTGFDAATGKIASKVTVAGDRILDGNS
jgi:predicted transcriptional regulator